MNQELPIDIVISEVERFKPFAIEAFNYLNGNINPFTYCYLYIRMYDTVNYAEFRKPNTVCLFLGSIICHFYGKDEDIKSVILMTLAHELSHSCQNTDMVRYTNDPYYREVVEESNEAHTIKWMTEHMNEIYKRFGFRYIYNNDAMNNLYPKHINYEYSALKEYYINCIIDVVYRNQKYRKPLIDLFDSNNNIGFAIDTSDYIFIKYNGNYMEEGLEGFNKLLSQYCRTGLAINYFNVVLTTRNIQNGIIIRLHFDNVRYCPINGIGTVKEIESHNSEIS